MPLKSSLHNRRSVSLGKGSLVTRAYYFRYMLLTSPGGWAAHDEATAASELAENPRVMTFCAGPAENCKEELYNRFNNYGKIWIVAIPWTSDDRDGRGFPFDGFARLKRSNRTFMSCVRALTARAAAKATGTSETAVWRPLRQIPARAEELKALATREARRMA